MGNQNQFPSGTVTFLFTDIEGSTRLAQEHPERWEALRARHHAILHAACDANHGYVFQIIGDAFCVAFYTAKDGLAAAIDVQKKMGAETWNGTPVKVRMGLHTGSAELHGNDYRGYLTMAKVQRIMSVAYGGQSLRLLERLADQAAIAECIISIGRFVGVQGSFEKFARLLGAAEGTVPDIKKKTFLLFQTETEKFRTRARAALGEEAYAVAYEAGKQMTLDEGVAYAWKELGQ